VFAASTTTPSYRIFICVADPDVGPVLSKLMGKYAGGGGMPGGMGGSFPAAARSGGAGAAPPHDDDDDDMDMPDLEEMD
jgi:hypothetical protein